MRSIPHVLKGPHALGSYFCCFHGCGCLDLPGEGWCPKDGCWKGSLSSTMAIGVNWLSEAFWIPRQPISLRAGRDVGRSLELNNVHHVHCGAFWMVNCRQDDKPSREQSWPVGPARFFDALRDRERRPPNLRDPLPDRVVNHIPHTFVSLGPELFAQVLRSSRRGAAAGPSGMMAEHLRPMFESTEDTELLVSFADTFAKGEAPQEIVDAIRMGRMTALRKLDGVRGIVVGDLFRRLVSRTLAKQFTQQVEDATVPFQYAFKTRAGCECVAHIFQSL